MWPRGRGPAVIALSAALALGMAVPEPAHAAEATPPGGTYDVTAYGAQGNGTTDATNAVAAAISAAQGNGGGTVYFPAGVYAFSLKLKSPASSIQIHGTVPVTLEGAARGTTSLVEHVADQSLLSVRTDGTAIEDLTLDTQTFGGGYAIGVQANNTVLQQAAVVGGPNEFALYYQGPAKATPTSPSYNTGNQILDTIVNDQYQGDGFSFSFQENGLIQNLTHTGSRLALYVDDNVTVDGDSYTPGTQAGATNGFWITPPSTGITINNFVTSGAGGVIGSANPKPSTNISITGEQFLSPGGFYLEVGNVNGLTVNGSSFNTANALRLNPSGSAANVSVQNSTVPAIRFAQPSTGSVGITFTNCTFPALVLNAKPAPTFQDTQGGATAVAITGGTWKNQAGKFSKGTNTTFTVSNLTGYP